jgi:hypothetical protein
MSDTSLLFGTGSRGVKFPLMALRVQQDLGPVRHVLIQRVVAGTMVVHYPFHSALSPAPSMNDRPDSGRDAPEGRKGAKPIS